MTRSEQEQRLFSLVLDALDDLYDQRFGGGEAIARSEVWLVRLLRAAGLAMRGSSWESRLLQPADEIETSLRAGLRGDELSDRALDATDDLRRALAAEL